MQRAENGTDKRKAIVRDTDTVAYIFSTYLHNSHLRTAKKKKKHEKKKNEKRIVGKLMSEVSKSFVLSNSKRPAVSSNSDASETWSVARFSLVDRDRMNYSKLSPRV